MNVEENVAALEAAIKKIKDAQAAEASALVVKPRDLATGRFQKKPKMTLAQKSAQTLHRVLQKKNEAGVTLEERVAEHLLETSLTVGAKDLMGGAKVLETVLSRVHGRVKPSQEEMDKDVVATHISAIYITVPNLPNQGELKPAEELRPHFDGAQPFLEGEVLYTNPQLSAAELQPEVKPSKPKAPKEKPEPVPSVPCTCSTDSEQYCRAHMLRPETRD